MRREAHVRFLGGSLPRGRPPPDGPALETIRERTETLLLLGFNPVLGYFLSLGPPACRPCRPALRGGRRNRPPVPTPGRPHVRRHPAFRAPLPSYSGRLSPGRPWLHP